VTVEEPQVRLNIEFGDNLAAAILTAFVSNVRDAVEHEHIVNWKRGIAGAKQAPIATLD
jgi:hypothetical protein